MKQLYGIARNIDDVIVGRIVTKARLFHNRRNLIYVHVDESVPKDGYLAIICKSNSVATSSSGPLIVDVENISELHDGDVVSIEPDGKINVLYEIDSHQNAIFVTERCNSNCIMCPQPPVAVERDKEGLNSRLISLIDERTKILGITGGEPTLLGDGLFDMLNSIHARIPNASLNLLSNGIRFANYDYAGRFAQSVRQDIVVDIPLYSDIDTIHNSIVRTESFYKTINGIYNLAKYSIKTGIRVVVHKMNYDRLPELSEYIYSNFPFVYYVAFMQMELMGYAKDNLSDLWIDPLDYSTELERAVLKLHHRDIRVSIYNTQLCILPDNIRRFAVRSISDWKNIYIDECEDCLFKPDCAGFFASSTEMHSRGIMAIKGLQTKVV